MDFLSKSVRTSLRSLTLEQSNKNFVVRLRLFKVRAVWLLIFPIGRAFILLKKKKKNKTKQLNKATSTTTPSYVQIKRGNWVKAWQFLGNQKLMFRLITKRNEWYKMIRYKFAEQLFLVIQTFITPLYSTVKYCVPDWFVTYFTLSNVVEMLCSIYAAA